MKKFALLVGLGLLLWLWPLAADAHGGNYILNDIREGYQVIASLAPAPLSVGKGDISIAVVDPASYQPKPVDEVTVTLTDPAGKETAYTMLAEGEAVYNGHTLDFSSTGNWQVRVDLHDNGSVLPFQAQVNVAGQGMRWLNTAIYFIPLLVLGGLIGIAALRNRLVDKAEAPSEEPA